MGEWKPISEFPFGTKWANAMHVLCCHADKRWIRMGKHYGELKRWYYSGTNERSQWSETQGDAPTHYMELPTLPEARHD